MRTTGWNSLPAFSRVFVAACAAALLAATPIAASAERQEARQAQPPPKGTPAPASVRGGAPPAQPAAGPSTVAWESYSVEVYGRLVKRAGKVATLLPLVATTETPVAEGTKAILFRRLEDPQSATPARWVEIARVTLKKIESSGNMQLTIDSEHEPPAGEKGKKQSYFVKGARLKLAVE